MIKFSCHSCAKKIGVPEEFAGKRVRCPQCKQPTRVPLPDPPVPEPALESIGLEPADPDIFSDLSDSAFAPPPPSGDPKCLNCNAAIPADSEFCVNCGHPVPTPPPTPAADTPRKLHAHLKQFENEREKQREATPITKMPVALLGGLIGATIGAALWATLTYFTGMEFGLVAWAVGALTGFGVAKASRQEHFLYGLLAVVLALLAIIVGRTIAIRLYFDKEMTKLAQAQDEIQKVAHLFTADSDIMFFFAARQLLTEDRIAREDIPYMLELSDRLTTEKQRRLDAIISQERMDTFLKSGLSEETMTLMGVAMEAIGQEIDEYYLDEIPEENLNAYIPKAQLAVELRDNWDNNKKDAIVAEYIRVAAQNTECPASASELFWASIGLIDILFALLAIASAYKIGEG